MIELNGKYSTTKTLLLTAWGDTAEIVATIKPLYNFKAAE